MTIKHSGISLRATALTSALAVVLSACATPAPATEVPPTEVPPTAAPTPEPTAAPAVLTIVQDFEGQATVSEVFQATASLSTDQAFDGTQSLKSESADGVWHTVSTTFAEPLDVSIFNQLCFYVFDTTTANDGKAANTVGLKLVDAAGASVERYTDNEGVGANLKTRQNDWTMMCMNLLSFTDIDQTQVASVEFTMYHPGVYYFDGLTLVPAGEALTQPEPIGGGDAETVYVQTFEADGTFYADYQAEVSRDTEVVHSGNSSLKAASTEGEWHAFGAYPDPRPIDLSNGSRLCFWIYDTTEGDTGNADNSVGVKLFDATGANEEVWTDNALAGNNPRTSKDEWVQMCMNLEAYSTVDLAQIDKIQFAVFWAGNYYVDDITLEP